MHENNLKARLCVKNMMEELELIDTWRSENQYTKKYTWVSGKRPTKMAKLDFFLVTPDIHAQIKKHSISFGYRDDHSFIGVEIGTAKRGRDFWKFNASLLKDTDYVSAVKKEIQNVVKDYTNDLHLTESNFITSKQMLWEVVKLRIRGVTIPYCAALKKNKKRKEAELEEKIKISENKLCLGENIVETTTEINSLKQDLTNLRESQIRHCYLRLKAEKYCDFEKPTKYFCNLEKRNSISKTVNRVTVKNKTITHPPKILEELRLFYKDLLTSKYSSSGTCSKFLSQNFINKLSESDN